jgi:GNAT superfamily N-acetyltransferase
LTHPIEDQHGSRGGDRRAPTTTTTGGEPVLRTDRSPRTATPSETGALSAALASAFQVDPIFSWLVPDPRRRNRRLQRFFALELQHVVLPVGRAWTLDGAPGASLELPPDRWRMPFGTQLAHAPAFTRVFGSRLAHAFALITLMERRHLREPHYYIAYVGLAPDAQGQGLGTTLLRPTLDRCDREQLPAYLEATSERSASLYERLGFEHLGPFRFASSPPLWPMRRPPSAPPPR